MWLESRAHEKHVICTLGTYRPQRTSQHRASGTGSITITVALDQVDLPISHAVSRNRSCSRGTRLDQRVQPHPSTGLNPCTRPRRAQSICGKIEGRGRRVYWMVQRRRSPCESNNHHYVADPLPSSNHHPESSIHGRIDARATARQQRPTTTAAAPIEATTTASKAGRRRGDASRGGGGAGFTHIGCLPAPGGDGRASCSSSKEQHQHQRSNATTTSSRGGTSSSSHRQRQHRRRPTTGEEKSEDGCSSVEPTITTIGPRPPAPHHWAHGRARRHPALRAAGSGAPPLPTNDRRRGRSHRHTGGCDTRLTEPQWRRCPIGGGGGGGDRLQLPAGPVRAGAGGGIIGPKGAA